MLVNNQLLQAFFLVRRNRVQCYQFSLCLRSAPEQAIVCRTLQPSMPRLPLRSSFPSCRVASLSDGLARSGKALQAAQRPCAVRSAATVRPPSITVMTQSASPVVQVADTRSIASSAGTHRLTSASIGESNSAQTMAPQLARQTDVSMLPDGSSDSC